MRKIFIIFSLFSLVFFAFLIFFFWQGIFLPSTKIEKFQIFEIKKGESVFEVARNLEKEGLIKNRIFFTIFIFLTQNQKNLKAGFYQISPSMSVAQISQKIINGQVLTVKVTIPEGFTLNQISEILIQKGILKESLNNLKAKDFKKDFAFLQELPDDFSLEGFLFPDTYFFTLNESPKKVVFVMLENFNQKFKKEWKEKLKEEGKSLYDVLILASLLEKEVQNKEDKKIVAGILWKRLEHQIPLQVDATINYLTGKKTLKISKEDLEIDSPYNTYKYKGLPPTPICNPGLDSIEAAIFPKETDFWYYLAVQEGVFFSKSYKEHLLLKEKYLK